MANVAPTEYVYQHIKNQIVSRELYPGNRIIEEEVARVTGVSRTPIRAALQRLAYEGLIVQQPNKGAFVAKPSALDLRHVFEVRQELEISAIRLACRRRSESTLRRLEENLRQQAVLNENFNMLDYANLNREFHGIIIMAAGNPYLEKYLNELYGKVMTYLIFWDNSTENSRSLVYHTAMYEALRDRDETRAVLALKQDLDIALDDICACQHL